MRCEKGAPASTAVACPEIPARGKIRCPGRIPGRRPGFAGPAGPVIGVWLLLAVLSQAGRGAESGAQDRMEGERPLSSGKKHILLLGASVGGGWKIEGFPQRSGNDHYAFEYVHGGSSFDKSRELRKILQRTGNRPDAIFLKECAAYFPGDLESYKTLMIGWIRECREAGIVPIPTTVVPVTLFHAYKKFGIDILKLRNPFRYGIPFAQRRLKAILAYNDWIRDYCLQSGLVLLDLEAALRKSPKNRSLRSGLARVDGLHLKPKAYVYLDGILPPLLEKIPWPESGAGAVSRGNR